ncbi:keratin, type I cytoskeletal 18 isoform X2 [Prionailurus bengalensis]|uniref:keratin, type I cytoskeletal 18 isoform X2 n=1 Tax=Felis catus TaxID=9685 RepID=UPI000948640E|nr:keratin, type I cytoskeletal 18 isoform X2 [Felis catus]XP_040343949.1 keratin, type I cytoskeletal 18 isoform X2 [Puma yagouaroundi]XP_043419966.1 keratin, type I cytoskeletal 18 isoform X2 [Prionailurus bengalensis]
MSFTTHSIFSSNYRSVGSVQGSNHRVRPVSSAASVYAGAGGSGSRISISRSSSFRSGWGSGGMAAVMTGALAGIGGIQGEKETMQDLNDRLASYLERVRSLEADNQRLEIKIREHLEKKGPQVRDWGHYFKTIEELRAQEVKGLQNQIANSGLTVELDAPKSQDLSKIMADIRAQYEELAKKNREELDKYWSQQIEESTTVITSQTAEIAEAEKTLKELRRTVQSLEINLDSMRNLKASFENSLREVEARYTLQMEQLNGVLLHLESELSQTRTEGQRQAQEYEALLNVKVKLEAEIATYRRLLEDGEDFSLSDALDTSNSFQTIQKTTTRRIVDGKVVSETNDTKVLRR